MIYFRRATASQEFALGPFVDSTDGVTAEDSLTIANTDIKFQWNGATTQTNKNSGGATHIAAGNYYATADATDTATCNAGKVTVQVAGALAWQDSCVVLPEPLYDSMFPASAGAPLPVFGIVDWGTAQASASGTLVHRSALALGDDILNGTTSYIYAGTGAGQSRAAYDFTGASDTSAISPNWTTTPSTDSLYVTYASAPAGTSGIPAVNLTQIAGQTASASGTVTFPNATLASTTNITAGTITTATNVTTVNGLAANSITAASTAADFIAEINAQVVDGLSVDTYAEPGQGAPGATISLAAKIGYLYKAWRNRSTQTASEYALYADDGTTKDQEATFSDNGTTADRGEVGTGA